MSFGIQLLGGQGQFAITENYRNPYMVLKSTQATVAEPSFLNNSRLIITYTRGSTTEASLCFIAPTANCSFVGVTESGNNITWTFFSNLAVGTNVPYYIFSDAGTPPPDSWGMHIFDSSGNRAFSTGGKPLRIVSVGSNTVGWLGGTNLTFVTGRSYAVAQTGFTDTSRYIIMSDTTNIYLGGCRQITNGIGIDTILYANTPGDQSGFDYGPMYYIICDVTDY